MCAHFHPFKTMTAITLVTHRLNCVVLVQTQQNSNAAAALAVFTHCINSSYCPARSLIHSSHKLSQFLNIKCF